MSKDADVLEIGLLGPLEVRFRGEALSITAPRLIAALGALLLQAGNVVPLHQLVESIWEDEPPSDPANQVAACMSMLRRAFRRAGCTRELVVTQLPGYVFPLAGVRLDTHTVRDLRLVAQRRLAENDPEAALTALEQALALWRGPVLSGTDRRAWQPEVHRWNEEQAAIRIARAEIQLDLGHYEDLIASLSAFIQQHPLLEKPRGILMTALYRTGRQADALRLYRSTADLLREELGVEPGADLQALHQRVLLGDTGAPAPAPAGRHTPTGPAPTAPSTSAAPPVPAAPPGRSVPAQLPGDLVEFTGRHQELRTLAAALTRNSGSVPVATVVGAGGTGKTALAVHTAHDLRPAFPDGQLYVNLHGMGESAVEPDRALALFLRELGFQGPLPETLDERAAVFRSLVADRRMLIVLDDASDTRQVLPLLPGTASCAVIVTSRMRLATVPSTCTLELEVLDEGQALELLASLVGSTRLEAEPETALELIRYCGMLPLALRIVGAKLAAKPHWSLRKAASRLADERRRLNELSHENLEVRACLELSYKGISAPARTLFRRLSLISASDFAEWVCSPLVDLPLAEAQDLLEELLDTRLLDVTTPAGAARPRYRMHDLVWLYAVALADEVEPGEERAAALHRLGTAALAMADDAHRAVCGGDFATVHSLIARPLAAPEALEAVGHQWLKWYEEDRATLTALCRKLAVEGHEELAWDLAATCRCLFSLRFHFDDWKATHEVALAAAERHGNERGAAAMLLGLGDLHLTKRQYGEALPLLARAQELFGKVGDRYGFALALRKAACADRVQGRFARALEGWETALLTLREVGDIEAQAQILRWTGQTLLELGRPDEAASFLFEAAELVTAFRGRSAPQVRLSLGDLHLAQGKPDLAAVEFARGFAQTQENGDLSGHCYALWGLGWTDVLQGRLPKAQERLEEGLDLARAIHDPLMEAQILLAMAEVEKRKGDFEAATAILREGAQICLLMGAPARLDLFNGAMAELAHAAR
ncbi:AfsR/SARP family transcriptional regulator [Streptomyces erythrochromogenes]|uniref:AfsR/SARP family transcriptional regulator n=1 Tax=Streptomyces erythrochromogenes TaxID=285574 RepID=UPI0033F436EA